MIYIEMVIALEPGLPTLQGLYHGMMDKTVGKHKIVRAGQMSEDSLISHESGIE
jgi:hypothetical protein